MEKIKKKYQTILQKMYPELFIIIGAKKNSNIIWLENNDLSSTSGNLFQSTIELLMKALRYTSTL